MPVVEYVASHQELFDADTSIYGFFQERLQSIRNSTNVKRIDY